MILENGGWGANAAPLARSLSDYYLLKLKGGSGDARAGQPAVSGAKTVDNPLLAGSETAPAQRASVFQTAYEAARVMPASGVDNAQP